MWPSDFSLCHISVILYLKVAEELALWDNDYYSYSALGICYGPQDAEYLSHLKKGNWDKAAIMQQNM